MRTIIGVVSLIIIALNPRAAADAQESYPDFTSELPLATCRFVPWGGGPYFGLSPGRQSYLSNRQCVDAGDCDTFEEVWITVKHDIRGIPLQINGRSRRVWARVVEELESEDGLLIESSENYFARCWGTGDIYYFGEEVTHYADGQVTGHEGGWLAGVGGARPGLMMPELFLLGARYYQEFAPGEALDRAEHVNENLDIDVSAGEFHGCVQVEETSALEPGDSSTKIYCPDVGLVMDEDLELVTFYD